MFHHTKALIFVIRLYNINYYYYLHITSLEKNRKPRRKQEPGYSLFEILETGHLFL